MGGGSKPAKGKAKPAVAYKSPTDDDARVRDLEKRRPTPACCGWVRRVLSALVTEPFTPFAARYPNDVSDQ